MKISQDKVISALTQLGYSVFRISDGTFKFHWNSKDTPDSSINKDGSIHRWSDARHGDFIDFLKESRGWSFKQAKEEAEKLLSVSLEATKVQPFSMPTSNKKSRPIDKSYLLNFEKDRREYFKQFSELLKCLLPTVKSPEKRKEIAQKHRLGYIKESNKLLIPHFELNGDWVTSAKYTPTPQGDLPKISFSKDRSKIPFNLPDMLRFRKEPEKWLLITEGHKDTLNANANGYHAITPGSASDKFREKDLELFRGLKVYILGDHDNAGFKFNDRIKAQLEGIAKEIKVVDWVSVYILNKIEGKPDEGFDFTDFLLLKGGK